MKNNSKNIFFLMGERIAYKKDACNFFFFFIFISIEYL